MLIYSIMDNTGFGAKVWRNPPQTPLKIGALIQEESARKVERKTFTSRLIVRWSVSWRG
ncbi:MAG: hypothetical protein H0Z18_08190 [Thermococcus sp.]|uniref:hypothetical protein n=1 Tax=Thermococcus sp. TaxID=35749 RepID=UPI001D6B2022|nr:hypothetical protein [Thermococcus sp.]MBO8175223.1 hypothetical protein [Thermococcus sp.]